MIRSFRRSILLQLLLFVGVSAFFLPAFTGIYLYQSFHRAIAVTIEKDLRTTANVVLHRLSEADHPVDKEILDVGEHMLIRITNPDKQVVIESKNMANLVPLALYPMPSESWVLEEGRKDVGHRIKLLTVAYPHGWVQIARMHDTEDELLRGFVKSLFVVLGTIPVLTALAGFVLVRQAVRSLRRMTLRAGSIRPENLTMRLDLDEFPRELAPLGEALNRTLARLETSFTRLGEMNGDLAHELRTPVHSLRLELEQLLSESQAPELEERLSGMMETLGHLGAVIEQMLFLARSEDPATRIERTPLDARQLVTKALAPFGSLAEEAQVVLQVDITGQPTLRGDPTLLRRALHNLLANALRHSNPGTAVQVRVRQEAERTLLEVADQGEGIPADVLQRLGQRFLRPDFSRSRKTGGAGLGLAIVQGIARMHQGTLEIDSPPGQGTTVRLLLPIG